MTELPKSKAKTAWGLLSDVIRAIRAEPKRIDMDTFGQRRPESNGGPSCGTVGCFAGWVAVLGGHDIRREEVDAEGVAIDLLGESTYCDGPIDYYTVGGDRRYVFNEGYGDGIYRLPKGTPEYVEAVVARIENFRRVNEKALKAKRLS